MIWAKGKENVIADGLSRSPVDDPDDDDDQDDLYTHRNASISAVRIAYTNECDDDDGEKRS